MNSNVFPNSFIIPTIPITNKNIFQKSNSKPLFFLIVERLEQYSSELGDTSSSPYSENNSKLKVERKYPTNIQKIEGKKKLFRRIFHIPPH